MNPSFAEQPPSVFFHVDERVFSSRMLYIWMPEYRARRAIVACDQVASDPRQRRGLALAAGHDAEIDFIAEGRVLETLSAARWSGPIVVIFRGLGAVMRAIEAGLRVPRLTITGLPAIGEVVQVADGVHLDFEGVRTLSRLRDRGVEVRLPRPPHRVAGGAWRGRAEAGL